MRTFALRGSIYKRPSRNRWPSRFFTLAATVIVLLVHVVWLYVAAVVQPMPMESSRNRVRVFSYTASASTSPALDVQLVKSPVLLSLPTRVGFSGPLLGEAQMDQMPALKAGPPEFFEPNEPFSSDPYGKSTHDLAAMVVDRRVEYVPGNTDPEAELNTFDSRPEQALTLYWLDEAGLEVQELSDALQQKNWGDAPWDARVYVCLNGMGRATQVLLDEPAPDALINDELLRSIRAVTFDDQPSRGCGRLMIRYAPLDRIAEEDN